MKRIFTLVALVAALVFTGCSKDDEGVSIPGGTPYLGELLGTWEYDWGDGEDYWLTFKSDGSFVEYWAEDGEWFEEYGLFFVSEDDDKFFTLQFMKAKASWGETYDYIEEMGEYYYEYYYVYEATSEYIEMRNYEANNGVELDWEDALYKYEIEGSRYTSGDMYYKK